MKIIEYDRALREYKRNNKLQDELQKKLEREYQEYLGKVFNKTKDEIIKSSYEITTKGELKEEINYLQLEDSEIQALLNQENLLDDLYFDWLDTDIPLGDVLIDSLNDSISTISRHFNKQKNEEELEK